MANPSDGLRIPIIVTKQGSGDTEAARGLKDVGEEAKKSAVNIRDYANAENDAAEAAERFKKAQAGWKAEGNNGGGGLASDPKTFVDSSGSPAVEERRTALLRQQEAILRTKLQLTQAQAAGDEAEAARLNRKLAIREATLQIMRQSGMTEAQARVAATQQINAEEQILAKKNAQAAAAARTLAVEKQQSAEARARAAAEKDNGLGGNRGRGGQFAENLGLNSGAAAATGVAIVGAQQLWSTLQGVAKAFDEARIANERAGIELAKQSEQWGRMAGTVQTIGDLTRAQEEWTNKIAEAEMALKLMPGVASGTFDFMLDNIRMAARETDGWLGALGGVVTELPMVKAVTAITGVETSVEKAKDKSLQALEALKKAAAEAEEKAQESAAGWKELSAALPAEQIDMLTGRLGALREQQSAVADGTTDGKLAWLALQRQVLQVESALEKATNALADFQKQQGEATENQMAGEAAKFLKNQEAQGEATEKQMAAEAAKFLKHQEAEQKQAATREEAITAAKEEQAALRAVIEGNERKIQQLESEARLRRDIAALVKSGVAPGEATMIAGETKVLRDAQFEKEQKKRQDAEDEREMERNRSKSKERPARRQRGDRTNPGAPRSPRDRLSAESSNLDDLSGGGSPEFEALKAKAAETRAAAEKAAQEASSGLAGSTEKITSVGTSVGTFAESVTGAVDAAVSKIEDQNSQIAALKSRLDALPSYTG